MNKSKINLVALLLLTTFLFHGVSCEVERTDQIIQNYNVVGDTYEAEFSNDWKVCKFRNYKAGGSEAIAYYKLD